MLLQQRSSLKIYNKAIFKKRKKNNKCSLSATGETNEWFHIEVSKKTQTCAISRVEYLQTQTKKDKKPQKLLEIIL